MQPFPQNAQPNFAGGHVFHQIEHVIVAEIIGRLEGRRLKALAKGVAVLKGHAQQVASTADRGAGRVPRVTTRPRLPAYKSAGETDGQAGFPLPLFPTPVARYGPFSNGPPIFRWPPLVALARHRPRPFSCRRPRRPPSRRECSAPCPLARGEFPLAIRRIHGPTDSVFIIAHVTIYHGNCIDIGVDEPRVPG